MLKEPEDPKNPSTMLLNRDTNPSKDDMEVESLRCSLPELYAFVENFNKNNKKSNLLKTYSILPSEAQKTLSQNLNTMPFTSETDMRKDVQPVYTCKVLRKDEERPTSMTELLYCSLLTSSLSTVERLSRSQQRLLQYGIPPPSHTFPYEILINYSNSLAITEQKSQSTKILPHLGASHIKPEKFTFEDKISAYLLADPEKQFMDLRDLEWKYYKGLVKWKHETSDSFTHIHYDSEKRFVESQEMPDVIFPPLVCKSLVIYPQIDYPKNITTTS